MKNLLALLVLIMGFSLSHCLAKTTVKDDFKQSTLNQPGQEYPQVNSQGYARFRIMAPEASFLPLQAG